MCKHDLFIGGERLKTAPLISVFEVTDTYYNYNQQKYYQ